MPFVARNYRVEFPAFGLDSAICFASAEDAKHFAEIFSREDRALVLVWSFAAVMYIARYDGRA